MAKEVRVTGGKAGEILGARGRPDATKSTKGHLW